MHNFHIPRWDELPVMELYLDQVVTLVNAIFADFVFFNADDAEKDNPLLTKTMINNYVKNGLIEGPIKKKYCRTQVAKLIVVCVLKQAYSMNEIKELIIIALNQSDNQSSYDRFCERFEKALSCTYFRKDYIDDEADDDYRYLLKSVMLTCSYKIYVKSIIYLKTKEKLTVSINNKKPDQG